MTRKKHKRKLNYKAIGLAALATIILICALVFVMNKLFNKKENTQTNTDIPTVEQETDNSGYSIRSNANTYQKELYKELEDLLKDPDSKGTAKAESISANFVADFFTLSNKTIKNDVGGAQFWDTSARINFRDSAVNTVYKNLELYLIDYKASDLPTVKKVNVMGSQEIISPEGTPFYYVELTWEYDSSSTFPIDEFQTHAYVELTVYSGKIYIYNFYEN